MFRLKSLRKLQLMSWKYLHLNPKHTGGGQICPPNFISSFSQKFFPATYDKTLCKFLLYTYEDSHNLFWSKIISREHVEYIYVAWVENVNFKICNFRVLRSILEQSFMKQKLFRIKKYKGRSPLFFDLSIFWAKMHITDFREMRF